MITRPMLAVAAELDQVMFPVIGSPKLDGIRCLKVAGYIVSRSFKPIPNNFIRDTLERSHPDGIDGEIMIEGATFSEITSAVMSEDGEPNFVYHMFDYVQDGLDKPYVERLADLRTVVLPYSKIVPTKRLNNAAELAQYELECLAAGYEGVMIRSIGGRYKCGRSTIREGLLLKIKQWDDFEAKIVGFVEKMHNENEAEENELGLSKRSTAKAGMVPANTLGKFLVHSMADVMNIKVGDELKVGSGEGLTAALRQTVWDNKEDYLNKIIKCVYQKCGAKDKPRFITFGGFRDPRDMSK